MIYIAYLIILGLFLKLERTRPSTNNWVRKAIPLLYILFVGLRGANVGVDTPVYYQHYFTFGQWGCDFVEVGFDWINQFCYHQGWSQAPFFSICAAFAILPVAFAINNRTSRKEYSIFMLLFCTMTFISLCNGMRQNMACGIFFGLIMYLQDTTLKHMYVVVIYITIAVFASLFHASVLLVLPLYFLKFLKLSNKTYTTIYVLSYLMIFVNIYSYIPDIEIGNRDYSRYAGGELTNNTASSLGFIATSIRNIIILLLLFKFKAFQKYPLIANISFMMLVFTNLGYNIPLMGRINMYFSFFNLFMISIIFAAYKDGKFSGGSILVHLLATIIIILSVYGFISPVNKVIPYTFYWQNSSYENFIK